ncbi:M1 family metallopeptidase [Streptococcus sciuri]|uniref:Aminopeptidase n=1 Tax=Streptococcus sciuri TaxID=2973939 RepID=A0ABT2F5D9_9STRE|nr:M1 family metallopeptidase [Streptococcus sciuri]MCS4487649.1 M1 family metallopeptidase [Streptococcus sciuri]
MMQVEHFVNTFVPENYNLFLEISRKDKVFTGNVAINGEALDNKISLHQKALVIHSILLDNQELPFEKDDANEAVHIELPETGSMTLVIEFSGTITDNMTGIYPSYYKLDGVTKEIISTQFESHFAREAFPCVDEPEAKATFDLSLKFDEEEGDLALSNMPEIDVERRKETGLWTFETTPRMSSYLLAFAFGALHGVTTKTKNGTLVGSYTTRAHQVQELTFSLDIAKRVIEFYEDYFGVFYPIPQSLHVAIPDFSAGAMENWGLVTYREIYLLVDENSTVSSRQQVALVIAHEVAHQWFGNLVTMKWWDDLWLNESFANMMEYVAIAAIEPSWNIFEDFQTSGVPLALKRDATVGVQSVHVEVNHPDEINTLFDPAIVYAKGSRLMHMLRRWLGDEAFAKGLKNYFEKYQYSNTVGYQLWEVLSQASGKDVAAFMNSWLEQSGYPVVTVSVQDDVLVISQNQFFIGEKDEKKRLWQIPLNSNWEGLPEVLTEKSISIPNYSDLVQRNDGALRLNTENTAHYVTEYTGELLDNLLEELQELDNVFKLQVIQERRLLAESGRISYASLVPLIANLKHETSYLVTAAIRQVIDGLKLFVTEGSKEEEAFKKLVALISRENYHRLGFEKHDGESDEDEMVRQITLANMIFSGDSTVTEKTSQIFAKYENHLADIPAAIRSLVLINQMKVAETEDLVSHYLDLYASATDGSFQRQLAQALSKTTNTAHLELLLSKWKDKTVVKPQDLASSWYFAFLSSDFTQGVAWQWAQENWDWIKTTLGGDMSFDRFVIYPANKFKTQERLDEFKAFFEPQLNDRAISRMIAMGIKEISARIALIQSDKTAVLAAIKSAID